MSSKELIDFIVIGAQKSATTSLFKYLNEHPDIYMPFEKEINFFSNDNNFSNKITWYFKEYFASADPMKLFGEASPNYMGYDCVPERIFSAFPNVKLIAILRNPIERAYSHFTMSTRSKKKDRSFEKSIENLIKRGKVPDNLVDTEEEFIMFGEYGRIFSNYLKYFSKDKIKIVFIDDLQKDPCSVMNDIFRFLEVSDNFHSELFEEKFHVGGKKRFYLIEKFLMSSWIKNPLRLILPAQIRRTLGYWLITEFTVKPTKNPGPNQKIRQVLAEYYRNDVTVFKNLFELQPPWNEFN